MEKFGEKGEDICDAKHFNKEINSRHFLCVHFRVR